MNFAIKSIRSVTLATLAATLFAVTTASAQVPQYGTNISLDMARKVMVAAVAESKKNS